MILIVTMFLAHAESWCATELVAHEWGVQVFSADGTPAQGTPIPDAYHRSGPDAPVPRTLVRTLPVDSGIRELPVVHFYGDRLFGDEIPLAVEVGFADGDAAAWFPQVDRVKTKRSGPQLIWDALTLTPEARSPGPATDVSWVEQLRTVSALWVNQDDESERFLFYEAGTGEPPPVRIVRGDTWTADNPHYVVHNDGPYDLLDVFVHTPVGDKGVPRIPAGSFSGFVLEPADEARRTELRAGWTTPEEGPVPRSWGDACVMLRNPADPFSTAADHRMYPAEVAALWSVWEDRFFPEGGATLLYRESDASLAANMPLSLYTDMYHDITLHRLGVVLIEGVPL